MLHTKIMKNIVIYGEDSKAIQAILDYDYACKKECPSVVGIIGTTRREQLYMWGGTPCMIPVYDNVQDCTKTNKVWGIVLLVSQRNVRRVTEEVLREGIKHIFILAENVPERDARVIRAYAKEHNARIVGPASVGALYVGELKVGHAGGLIENLTRQDLLTKGDVAVVSKSGGMLNELMSVVRRSGRYVHTAIALGGDRFPATPLVEMVEELSKEKSIHTILVLGETGGTQENELAAWLRTSKISQKVVVHILGVGGKGFEKPIQFGHAGAMANTEEETPFYKMKQLEDSGAVVVESFGMIEETLRQAGGAHGIQKDMSHNHVPKDFKDALASGEVRYTPSIVSSIHFDYKEAKDKSLGQIIGELWLGISVPAHVAAYFEIIIKMLADHGPLVSGAHNTIVTTRAGKDLVSSLASGLLTIGPRFGGAINGSARCVIDALQKGYTAEQFVEHMKTTGVPIPGIGHKLYSVTNNDPRVLELVTYAEKHFSSKEHRLFFKNVEAITLNKKDNLIMNVDGAIAMTLLDVFTDLGLSKEEIKKYVQAELFNAFFVLARSIGFIAHHIDQVRLGEGLYRHPEHDVFVIGEGANGSA